MELNRISSKVSVNTPDKHKFERIDMLRSRAGLLTGKDRLLMQMYLDKANTFRQMARLAGVNDANIARHIHKIVRRLLDGQFITCLRNRNKLTPAEIDIARDYLLTGLSIRQITRKRNVTYYAARNAMKKIQQLTAS